jgi:1-acyl-sn-glycerol-3-phosphate acyltransferase
MRVPALPDCLPRRGNAFAAFFSRTLLGAAGWTIEGDFPNRPKMVAIVAPHTSNWDFIVGILAVFAIGIRVRFLAKHMLFKPPLGWLMRWFGGMPVNREAPQGLVPQVVEAIEKSPSIFLAITPAGTRSSTRPWKSGF